jgi:hypothetical protein
MAEGYGRNLFTVLGVQTIPAAIAEIRRRCNNNGEIDSTGIPDFRGIMIGDYIDGLDLSAIGAPGGGEAPQAWNDTYKNNRVIVSGFNTFKGSGDTEVTKNHILFTFRNIVVKAAMNTAINDGSVSSEGNKGSYPATELREWLDGPFAGGLNAALGGDNPLLTINKLFFKSDYTADVAIRADCTVWIPTEYEIFGENMAGTITYRSRENVHFPVYQKSSVYRAKRYNGSRDWWWSSVPHLYTYFTAVSAAGATFYSGAGSAGGCSPAFCVA